MSDACACCICQAVRAARAAGAATPCVIGVAVTEAGRFVGMRVPEAQVPFLMTPAEARGIASILQTLAAALEAEEGARPPQGTVLQ